MKELLDGQKKSNDEIIKKLAKSISTGVPAPSRLTVAALVSAATAIPPILQSLTSNAADLASYFQSNFNVTGQEFELAREAIINQLAGLIEEYHPVIFNFYTLKDSEIIKSFFKLLNIKQLLLKSQLELQIRGIEPLALRIAHNTAALQASKEALKNSPGNATELQAKISKLEEWLQGKNEELEEAKSADKETIALFDAFDKFTESVTKPASPTDLPLLTQATLHDVILEKKISHLLWVKPISSGGEAITRKQLFSPGRLSYVGACVVSYALATVNGTIISAGTKQAIAQITHDLSKDGDFRSSCKSFEDDLESVPHSTEMFPLGLLILIALMMQILLVFSLIRWMEIALWITQMLNLIHWIGQMTWVLWRVFDLFH
jgi:hypothetical protein